MCFLPLQMWRMLQPESTLQSAWRTRLLIRNSRFPPALAAMAIVSLTRIFLAIRSIKNAKGLFFIPCLKVGIGLGAGMIRETTESFYGLARLLCPRVSGCKFLSTILVQLLTSSILIVLLLRVVLGSQSKFRHSLTVHSFIMSPSTPGLFVL